MANGTVKRLMVCMPPRHGKSEFISHFFTSWYLAVHPERRIILTSYEAQFAARWGRLARNTVEEFGYLFGTMVSPNSSAANRWDILGDRGGMITAGVGGPITGYGADLLIIDDPVKNAEEASSQVVRDATWDWYRSTAYTRLEPGGAIVLIMTRWHEDDLAGRLLLEAEQGGEKWETLVLPAIAEEGDPLGRAPGEALWPERFPIDELRGISRTLGSYMWSALYQQRPQPAGGQFFRRPTFRYYRLDGDHYILQHDRGEKRVPISRCWRFQTVDPSASERETADYFVVMTVDVTPDNDLLVVDIRRERAETTKHDRIMDESKARWAPLYQAVESKTFGLNILQSLKRKGYAIKELKADTDKVSRARPVQAMLEAEQVFFPAAAPWLDAFEHELLAFPRGAHDDQVDCLSYAGLEIDSGRLDPSRFLRYASRRR